MKKSVAALGAVFLCAVLMTAMVSATAAVPSLGAYEYYQKSSEKMEGLKSMVCTGQIRLVAEVRGILVDDITNSTIRQVVLPDGVVEQSTVVRTSDGAVGAHYYRDGYMYMQHGNRNIKYKMDVAGALMHNGANISSIDKAWLDNATVTEEKEGRRIRFQVTGSQMNKLLDLAMTNVGEGPALRGQYDEIRFDGVVYNVLLGYDDVVKDVKMTYHITMKIGNAETKAQMILYYKVIDVNSVEKIQFPADLDSYTSLEDTARQKTPA